MSVPRPRVPGSAYVAEGAVLRGDVTLGERVSVWFNAVVRGDEGTVRIGDFSNIQDCCVIHSDLGVGVDIGARVSIGHGAVVRGARIEDAVMIGMGAVVMTGVVVGKGLIVGAASFVAYRAQFPPYSMIYGSPARLVRPLEQWEREQHRVACETYLRLIEDYRAGKWRGPKKG